MMTFENILNVNLYINYCMIKTTSTDKNYFFYFGEVTHIFWLIFCIIVLGLMVKRKHMYD